MTTTATPPASAGTPSTPPAPRQTAIRRAIGLFVTIAAVATFGYAGISTYIAYSLAYEAPKPVVGSPADYGLTYQEVTFPSRVDHIMLRGWFIPGVLPSGKLTDDRTIVMVHGTRTNRADKAAGLLQLSCQLAKQGFAILAFDMRGSGESPPEPLSLGYFEQRDVLGAVDFLRTGTPPYPDLGRPRVLGGWGVSMGGATLLLAAAHEPALAALVSDSAYSDIIPILEREVPLRGHVPDALTPGGLLAVRELYGYDFYSVRPVDVVGTLNRPLLLIHSDTDDYVPFANFLQLTAAAAAGPEASQMQQWHLSGPKHAQAFNQLHDVYVQHIVTFYTAALGADKSPA
ncbi:MAG TPA: alpha/beta fold hydrolase, partial [Ktedonobacterales bacterium]